MRTLPRARFIAAALHAILFAVPCVLFWVANEPILPEATIFLFVLLFVVDLPISAMAFGVMLIPTKVWLAFGLWGVAGTIWWYFLGVSIEKWKRLLSGTSEKQMRRGRLLEMSDNPTPQKLVD